MITAAQRFDNSALFTFPSTSHELQYISVTSGFTRLSMKIKYVCRDLISLYENFHNNRTMRTLNLHVKNCRWGEKEKEPTTLLVTIVFQNSLKFLQMISITIPFPPKNISRDSFCGGLCNCPQFSHIFNCINPLRINYLFNFSQIFHRNSAPNDTDDSKQNINDFL